MTRAFLDTNILVYLFDEDEPDKQDRATALFEDLAEDDALVVSTQVLQEFYAVCTRTLARPLEPGDAAVALEAFTKLPVVTLTPELILSAAELHQEGSISFWDALIVQAALSAGADVLYTEDMQDGRRFGGLVVCNPFA